MAAKLRATDNVKGQTVAQGFAAHPDKSQEITIPAGGETDPIDVTGWLGISWGVQDLTTAVTRRLNGNVAGRTAISRTEYLWHDVTAVTFEGPAGTVIELEGM